jgi:polar amino acid transport system ATP-binding protein
LASLEIRRLSARYGAEQVLFDVELSIETGDVVSLIGPSGSGKSTLLRTLVGLTQPFGGDVYVQGERIDYTSAPSVRRARDKIGIVFQQYNLFQNMNVLKNVTIGPVKIKGRPRLEVEAEATEVLNRMGLGDKLQAMPENLSGGQQQRVAIARSIVLRPAVLLLDEITSALDPELVTEVLDVVRQLAAEGMTLLIVSHEMAFVREISSRVVMMDAGRIVEVGRPDQVFEYPQAQRTRDFVSKILRH